MVGSQTADIAVVIVSYQCRDVVLACVDRILTTPWRHRVTVTVVDNGSTDGTVEALGDRCGVVAMGRNAGFAVANNAGFDATASRHVLVLNPDTLVDPESIDLLVDFLDTHPDAGVVAPRLVNADGTDQLTARAFPTPAAALFGRRSPLTRLFPRNRFSTAFLAGRDAPTDRPFRVDWVSGAAMAVPRSVVEGTGGFDTEFFMFWEDADWCRRIAEGGHDVWCEPAARIVHDEGTTRGKSFSPRLTRSFHRGAYLYWRNHHAPQVWNPLRWVAWLALATRATTLIALDALRHPRRRNPVPIPTSAASATASLLQGR